MGANVHDFFFIPYIGKDICRRMLIESVGKTVRKQRILLNGEQTEEVTKTSI
jgi:hypothetical protein